MRDALILPDCMVGPSDPCEGYSQLNERIAELEREIQRAKDHMSAIDEENHHLKRENRVLRKELQNIVDARMSNFDDHAEFFHWARNRARHTLHAPIGKEATKDE